MEDTTLAFVVVALLVLVIGLKQFSFPVMEVLLKLPRPVVTAILLLVPVVLYAYNKIYTALIALVMVVYLIQDIWKAYPESGARRLFLESGRDQTRFDRTKSIDLQFADHTAIHDSPNMLYKASDTPLLIHPPSAQVLHEMCG
jgi:hypothetical protein